MVHEIQGNGGLSPSERKNEYKEYTDVAKKFQEALDGFKNPNLLPEQKDFYKSIMHQYSDVMHKIASNLNQAHLLQRSDKIDQDLSVLDKDDSATDKLQSDLDKAKHHR